MSENYFDKTTEELQILSCSLFDCISDELDNNQKLHMLIEVERALVLKEEQTKL